ncbi:MAG: hypothetical protein Q8O67_12820 [Deltaproteobacteria bacterium]|nr:hypothetical protein [Deltaproteobacteria bacterium]
MTDSPDPRTHELRKFLSATLRQVNAIPLADYEDADCDLTRELVPRIVAVTSVASEILTLVARRYEPDADHVDAAVNPDLKLLREVDQRLNAVKGGREIADLAFMARMGLQWRIDRALASVVDDDRWRVIGQCSSARREVIKSCTAVDVAICRCDGIESENRGYLLSEIARSLEVRRQYTLLRRALLRDADDSAQALLSRLRLAATGFAKLTSRPIYPDLRVNDRQQIRGLQGRILGWLREHQSDPERGARAAIRLATDIAGFAELLDGVNNRSELREHDLLLVDEARSVVSSANAAAAVPDALLARLELLLSRDAAVDRLIDSKVSLVGPWRVALDALHQRLGGRTVESAVEGDFL